MKRKTKLILIFIFIAVFAALAAVAAFWGIQKATEGTKKFQVEIISERDGYNEIIEVESDHEFLGEYLRETDFCVWSDSSFGIYIIGFYDMMEDTENEYWWNVAVNGESAATGADQIPLAEGNVYTFTLMQGW